MSATRPFGPSNPQLAASPFVRALHQRHEYVGVVDAVELATVALELDALDTAEVRRRHGRFAESATKTGPSKGEKNAHAEAPDAAEAFELSPRTNAALCSIGGPTTKAM